MDRDASNNAISKASAHWLTLGFALTYVGSLYISKNARLSFARSGSPPPDKNGGQRQKDPQERWRDDPDVIKARLGAVASASFICGIVACVAVARSVPMQEGKTVATALQYLGLYHTPASIYPFLLTPLLFAGPLYASYLEESLPFQKWWEVKRNFLPLFTTWVGFRNYIAAPITEEFVFRACVLAMYHLSGASKSRMIFLSPLSFGAAHVHHAWDIYNRYGRTSAAAKRAIVMSLFQFTYTTLFGFYCAFLFLRTGSVLPPISAHVFCNIMGVPQLPVELQKSPHRKSAIITAYLFGIAVFIYKCWSWTEVSGSIYWQN